MRLGDREVFVLKFADDVTAPADNIQSLQTTLDRIALFSEERELPINYSKCFVVEFSGRSPSKSKITLSIAGNPIEQVSEFT